MKGKTTVITCGCRFNRFESAEILQRLGESAERPVVVINSCAVTRKSEAKSRHAVRRAARENPGSAIVVAGCWAELDPETVKAIEGVDLVLGNEEKFEAGGLLAGGKKVLTGGVKTAGKFLEIDAGVPEDRTAAYLKIQNGCDEICSFCVVRLVRGKSRSASPEFVLRRVDGLISLGAKEIVFTGINIGRYDGGISLEHLLKMAAQREGARFRLSSINPNDVTDGLIRAIADSPNVCRHLHVPLQSGSDGILKKMERPYSSGQYRERVEKIASVLPGLGLGCDVMAGFPGESERDFEGTLRLLSELPFSYAHVFPYSPREKTAAWNMKDAVPDAVKNERVSLLKEVAAAKNLAFREEMKGREFTVLVETGKAGATLKGKTDTFVPVEIAGGPAVRGRLARVRVEGVAGNGVRGAAV